MIRLVLFALALLAAGPAAAQGRTFMLTGFDRVRVDGPFEVTLTAGPRAAARAEGDARALDRVAVRVEANTLIVSAGANGWGGWTGAAAGPVRVAVMIPPGIRGVQVRGAGRVTADRLAGQRIELALSGSGRLEVGALRADLLVATVNGAGAMTLGGRAARANLQLVGSGSLDAGRLEAADLTITSSSSGDARANATRTASVAATGLGSVEVDGRPACTLRGTPTAPVRCGD